MILRGAISSSLSGSPGLLRPAYHAHARLPMFFEDRLCGSRIERGKNCRRIIYKNFSLRLGKTIDPHAHWIMFDLLSVTRAVRIIFDAARNEGKFLHEGASELDGARDFRGSHRI